MTDKLRQAISAAEKLPIAQQDVIASLVLNELDDESEWTKQFTESLDVLELLAEETDSDDEAGRTTAIDQEKL
jgi:hypothetical protein